MRGWLDPRAGAVRVGLAAAGQGRMLYRWSAPQRSRSALQAAAGAYDEIEVRPADTLDVAGAAAAGSPTASDGDDVAPARERDQGDSVDELDLDEAEALGELLELSPFWAGDPGPEEGGA